MRPLSGRAIAERMAGEWEQVQSRIDYWHSRSLDWSIGPEDREEASKVSMHLHSKQQEVADCLVAVIGYPSKDTMQAWLHFRRVTGYRYLDLCIDGVLGEGWREREGIAA